MCPTFFAGLPQGVPRFSDWQGSAMQGFNDGYRVDLGSILVKEGWEETVFV
jgi:hypothetical protein